MVTRQSLGVAITKTTLDPWQEKLTFTLNPHAKTAQDRKKMFKPKVVCDYMTNIFVENKIFVFQL